MAINGSQFAISSKPLARLSGVFVSVSHNSYLDPTQVLNSTKADEDSNISETDMKKFQPRMPSLPRFRNSNNTLGKPYPQKRVPTASTVSSDSSDVRANQRKFRHCLVPFRHFSWKPPGRKEYHRKPTTWAASSNEFLHPATLTSESAQEEEIPLLNYRQLCGKWDRNDVQVSIEKEKLRKTKSLDPGFIVF